MERPLLLMLMVAVAAARTQVATADTVRGLVPSEGKDRDTPPSAKLGNETTLIAFADGQLAARNNLWKRKIFLVLGQSNANGRANAARLTEDDRRRLAKVADRVILTYRGDMTWGLSEAVLKRQNDPGRRPSEPDEDHHLLATRARRVELGPVPNHPVERYLFGFTDSFGPELFYGIALAEAMPGELIHIVKLASPGSSLYAHWNVNFTKKAACHMVVSGGPPRGDGGSPRESCMRPDSHWRVDGVPASEEIPCDSSACATNKQCSDCCAAHGAHNVGASCSEYNINQVALYPTVVADVQELVKRGGEVAGFLWHQGERDQPDAYARAYQANLEEFVLSLRQDLQAVLPGTLFCGQGKTSGAQIICNAQQHVANILPNLKHFSSTLHRYTDDPGAADTRRVAAIQREHLDYAGQKRLGLYAAEMHLHMSRDLE